MNKEAKRNSISMIVLLLCTITIIGTNYIFTQKTVTNINELFLENEYQKIGGKDNYLILQEIQKREILGYIEKLKKEEPKLIEEILKATKEKVEKNEYKLLTQIIINDLKKNTFIKGNSGALISIIEFSDMECPYCIEQHKEKINEELLENYSDIINYSFKNFPIPAHENANIEAQAAKCVEYIEGGEKYLEYIDNIFNTTVGGGKGFNIKELDPLSQNLGIDNEKFNKCMTDGDMKDFVEREFKQGVMLGINSVPSNLIINNKTGEYIIISETKDYDEIEEIILDISK